MSKTLMKTWLDSICFLSNPDQMLKHPSYKAYVKSDDIYTLVDELIGELKVRPCSAVLSALSDITKDSPIKVENRGYIQKMAEDWLEWYKNCWPDKPTK